MEAVGHFLSQFVMGFVNLILLPWHIFQWANLETLKLKMNAIVIGGMSQEFFFLVLAIVLILVAVGIWKRPFLRGTVLKLEAFNGRIGQFAAWFALIMAMQQVLIIATGQIFRGNELLFAPFGLALFAEELQWLSGQLKFYNAILIAMASAYAFIEGAHVRVDLVYAATKKRTQHWIDLLGTIFFLFPSTVLLWWFAWPLATNSVFAQRPMNIWSTKASWRNVKLEVSGTAEFSWVWAFKILILVFAALMFVVAVSFLLRNIWALLEPEDNVEPHRSLSRQGGDAPQPTQ